MSDVSEQWVEIYIFQTHILMNAFFAASCGPLRQAI